MDAPVNLHYGDQETVSTLVDNGRTLFGYLKVSFPPPDSGYCCCINDAVCLSGRLVKKLLQGCFYVDRGCWRVSQPASPEDERTLWMEGARVANYLSPLLYLTPDGPPVMPAACARQVWWNVVSEAPPNGSGHTRIFQLWWNPWMGTPLANFNTAEALATEVDKLNRRLAQLESKAPPLRAACKIAD